MRHTHLFQVVLKTISLCLRATCINHCIHVSFPVTEILSKFKLEPRKWMKSLKAASQLTGDTKKAQTITLAKNKKKLKRNFTGSKTWSIFPKKIVLMPKTTCNLSLEIFLSQMSTVLPLRVKLLNYQSVLLH